MVIRCSALFRSVLSFKAVSIKLYKHVSEKTFLKTSFKESDVPAFSPYCSGNGLTGGKAAGSITLQPVTEANKTRIILESKYFIFSSLITVPIAGCQVPGSRLPVTGYPLPRWLTA
jgi:hypothetical protein